MISQKVHTGKFDSQRIRRLFLPSPFARRPSPFKGGTFFACACAATSGASSHVCNPGGFAAQSLDEMTFERGLWGAARSNQFTKVQELLGKKHNPNALDSSGYTPLHYAARLGSLPIITLLIENGADPNAGTAMGKETPLHRAAYMGHLSAVKYLVENGALILLTNSDGESALHKAAREGKVDVIKSLIAKCPEAVGLKSQSGEIAREKLQRSTLNNLFEELFNLLTPSASASDPPSTEVALR